MESNALFLREERKDRGKGQSRLRLLVFKCANPRCTREIKIPHYQLGKYTGLCKPCSAGSLGPYSTAYNRLQRSAASRELSLELTYEDYLELTKIPKCFYCEIAIPWNANRQLSYFLDRKNQNEGYTKENVVVCCCTCNQIRGAQLNFEEMLILKPSLIALAQHRGICKPSFRKGSSRNWQPSPETLLKMSKAQSKRQEIYRHQRTFGLSS